MANPDDEHKTSTVQASLTVLPSYRLNPINRLIYSGFIEHMGRCVYGGIFDPTNSNKSLLTESTNLRKDVIETYKPLEVPVFRYPGGNFTATYHWQDGIGPVDKRPARLNLAWGGQIEDNSFGTNEFIVWCRDHMNAEPYLCLNMGTGTLDEALAWLEYCNATGKSYFAKLRREHLGHDKPHAVKYWGLGNEVWGPWQIAQTETPHEYAEKAMQWAKALKLLDPTIKLILCGKEGISSWDYEVIKHAVQPATQSDLGVTQPPLIDYVSIHMYTSNTDYHSNVFAPLSAERSIEVTSALIDIAATENRVPPNQAKPLICFDEWNVWDAKRAIGSKGAEERYTLADALAVAVWLNVFVRQSAKVGMACIAQSVNVISPLMTTKDGLIKQTSWYVYELFCKYMNGHRIQFALDCESYTGELKPNWQHNCLPTKMLWLDVSACVDDEGYCCVAVANLHKDSDISSSINGIPKGTSVQVYTVTGSSIDVNNMDGTEHVKAEESSRTAEETYRFAKHSFTLLRWKL